MSKAKIKIVEAYFGDPSSSGELQFVRKYLPEEIRLGYYDKNWQCVTSTFDKLPKNKELCIAYKVSAEEKEKIF